MHKEKKISQRSLLSPLFIKAGFLDSVAHVFFSMDEAPLHRRFTCFCQLSVWEMKCSAQENNAPPSPGTETTIFRS